MRTHSVSTCARRRRREAAGVRGGQIWPAQLTGL
jgi:hypothetical protein